jgi:hypothetical protein
LEIGKRAKSSGGDAEAGPNRTRVVVAPQKTSPPPPPTCCCIIFHVSPLPPTPPKSTARLLLATSIKRLSAAYERIWQLPRQPTAWIGSSVASRIPPGESTHWPHPFLDGSGFVDFSSLHLRVDSCTVLSCRVSLKVVLYSSEQIVVFGI